MLLILTGCRDEQKIHAEQDVLVNRALEDLVTVKGGRFQMGDFGSLTGEKLPFSADTDNKPLHWVILSDFRISKYRVTWGEFNRWLEIQGRDLTGFYKDTRDNKYTWKSGRDALGDNYPASANWQDAQAYCRWLGQVSKRHIDLPTAAQWEYAARSRGQFLILANSDNHWYYEDNKASNFAPSAENRPVGSYDPNSQGLYDMLGNGTDWVMDWYAADYYRHSREKDPQGPATGVKKVIRGWLGAPSDSLTVTRDSLKPDTVQGPPSRSTGFRCVENSPLAN
ncbi:formylglycine-generating enzyme family protein [Enterobacter pseudoroggenkampii]|uniref:formylglycine-generating enzyme family protein n=1 Tax=Enterobacter pseudoroggenkampii TaxID=2996112 RepID=UPI002264006C|nr:SUMF1/EgtB/PvdO family nonheme iron enzyme [Enterobacter pseudoroggenkampii]MCX8288714.1 SUMF1/EgtB/PvdO family nonheme iron enzyme [Enterobacter pseudoroggenkampii]